MEKLRFFFGFLCVDIALQSSSAEAVPWQAHLIQLGLKLSGMTCPTGISHDSCGGRCTSREGRCQAQTEVGLRHMLATRAFQRRTVLLVQQGAVWRKPVLHGVPEVSLGIVRSCLVYPRCEAVRGAENCRCGGERAASCGVPSNLQRWLVAYAFLYEPAGDLHTH